MLLRKSTYIFFWRVSGEDPQIIKKAKYRLKVRFLASGITVFVLFWISVFSYHYSFNKLFNLPILSWVIGLVFTMMIINIYRLNIITLTPKKLSYSLGYIASLAIRIFFIVLIGLTVIKPLELILLNKHVEMEIEAFKHEKIEETMASSGAYFDEEIKNTEKELSDLISKIDENRISDSERKVEFLETKLKSLKSNKTSELEEIRRLLNNSPYFIESLILINTKYPKIWLITAFLLLIFLSPFFIKFTTNPSGFYSRKQMLLQEKIILEEYQLFKKRYKECFKSKLGLSVEFVENYENPPFNTIRKKDNRIIGKETDFINHLYGQGED
ncbi:DUF4407 domain-containing protein [uncultured Winogradskyella sp.]|uniref:DUF4407 domain-containing protein n=1 Tax=uncultured Winogradskyella sp. TaxID=395353 RepID=UPI00351358FB